MINIPHIDKHIWNAEYRALEIISELQRTGSAVIAIDNEGSDLAELGLYQLLDGICSTFGFNKSSILIQTRNQLESHSEYKIQKFSPMHLLTPCHDFVKRTTIADKQLDDIKHFGIFISRSNWQRLMLSSYLYKNYKPTTIQTYHYDSNSDYHKSHLSFDTLAHLIGLANAADLTKELFASLPITNDTIDSYPIVTKDYLNISKLYKHFFVEIVCETFSEGKTFFPTEKIWRPIMCKTPFIVQGPVNYLHNLKQLGFKHSAGGGMKAMMRMAA